MTSQSKWEALSFSDSVRLIASYRNITPETLMLEYCSEAMSIPPDVLSGQMVKYSELLCAWAHYSEQHVEMAMQAMPRPVL